jgi:glycosyltransferase involved in cell wall biosynthesis
MFGGFLNHEYALPNKLFEYIQSGLCVLVSDLVEMKQLVSQYDVGQVFIRDNSIDLEDKLSYLIANKSRVSHYKSMAIRAAEELNWEEEEKKLFALYASKP